MNTYVYVLKLSERLYDNQAWTSEDNASVNAHFHRIQADFNQGKIIHVGRTENPTHDGFGIVVFKANSIEDAIQYMNDDPAVKNQQMTAQLFPYKHIF